MSSWEAPRPRAAYLATHHLPPNLQATLDGITALQGNFVSQDPDASSSTHTLDGIVLMPTPHTDMIGVSGHPQAMFSQADKRYRFAMAVLWKTGIAR